MTQTLKIPIATTDQASLDARLRVAGADDWTLAALQGHKEREQRRANKGWHVAIPRVLSFLGPRVADRSYLLGFIVYLLGTSLLFPASFGLETIMPAALASLGCLTVWQWAHWKRWVIMNSVQYQKRHGELPQHVLKLRHDIKRIVPSAKFEIEVLGGDPILYCLAEDAEFRMIVRRPVRVWDENGDIVLPPAA